MVLLTKNNNLCIFYVGWPMWEYVGYGGSSKYGQQIESINLTDFIFNLFIIYCLGRKQCGRMKKTRALLFCQIIYFRPDLHTHTPHTHPHTHTTTHPTPTPTPPPHPPHTTSFPKEKSPKSLSTK